MANDDRVVLEFDKDGRLNKKAWKVLKKEMEKAGATYIALEPKREKKPNFGPAERWPVGNGGICGAPEPPPPPPVGLCKFRQVTVRDE